MAAHPVCRRQSRAHLKPQAPKGLRAELLFSRTIAKKQADQGALEREMKKEQRRAAKAAMTLARETKLRKQMAMRVDVLMRTLPNEYKSHLTQARCTVTR